MPRNATLRRVRRRVNGVSWCYAVSRGEVRAYVRGDRTVRARVPSRLVCGDFGSVRPRDVEDWLSGRIPGVPAPSHLPAA